MRLNVYIRRNMADPERKTLNSEHHWTDDPVLVFILDPKTSSIIHNELTKPSRYHPNGNPVSHRRWQWAGLGLLQKRCKELGWPELDAATALAWQKEARNGQ